MHTENNGQENSEDQLIVNVEENCASLKISKEIYLRILNKAIEQTKQDITEVDTAISTDDFEKIQSLAHRFKGDYANMRIVILSEVARQINDIAKTSKDKQQISTLFSQFTNYFTQLTKIINTPPGESS